MEFDEHDIMLGQIINERKFMPNARDHSKMKNVTVWLTVDFKERLKVMARKRGVTMSDLIRDLLKEEAKERRNIDSQKH